jgi:carboxylesterase type B
MIFVQINYRVGAFGFLASEKIRRDGNLNVGLLDQSKALEWARKYIHLVGEYSSSHSTLSLMY